MKMRGISFFLAAVLVFSFLSQSTVRALWIQQNGHLLWSPGEVLGKNSGDSYTYIIKPAPTEVPTATPTPTPTDVPVAQSGPIVASVNTPTPTPSDTPTPTPASSSSSSSSGTSLSDWLGGLFSAQSTHDNNSGNDNKSSSSSSSSSSIPPSATPIPTIAYCGNYICTVFETCYQSTCWQKCDVNGNCLGQYYCHSGACLPLSGSTSSYNLVPTATPIPVQKTQSYTPQTPLGSDPYATPTTVPTPIIPNRPTNTPYPTRVPQNSTYFKSGTGGGAPVIIPPTPTPIPDSLQGKNSTIVIETGNTTTILKGEDVKAITIAAPVSAAEHQNSSAAEGTGSGSGNTETQNVPNALNLALVQKTGTKFALKQEELVVQKGKQKVTISAGGNNSGSLVLTQNDIKADVSMSLSINPNTNILTVDTPSGPMRVSIMPDDAVAIARQLKIADPNQLPHNVTLLSRNDQLEYKISATKIEKLFWIIPIIIPQEVYLSADTGGLVDIQRTNLYNFVTLFTF